MGPLPALVAHADWSANPAKRWMAVAIRRDRGYLADAPKPVGDAASLLNSMRDRAAGATILVGFDFPIGVPSAYAKGARIPNFLDALKFFGRGDWACFYEPASVPAEISIHRPFYPFSFRGGSRRGELTAALRLSDTTALLRRCELPTAHRNAACPLFWTLGGNQVGRAAIAGWREVVAPATCDPNVAVWPFQGDLDRLLDTKSCVIAETYPAEAGIHLGLKAAGCGWSKRKREGRLQQTGQIEAWLKRSQVESTPALKAMMADGFGDDAAAEDRFDAVVGLFSMLNLALGLGECRAPSDEDIRSVEGWILGQATSTALSTE